MTREERCELAIKKGYIYNSDTGIIYNTRNKPVKSKRGNYIRLRLICNTTKKMFWLSAHRFAWYCINKKCGNVIDHINGIRDDNRICNLREITNQQNHFNRPNAKGYYWNKNRNKWHATIEINYQKKHLGVFNTEQEARNAYLAAKEIYHKI